MATPYQTARGCVSSFADIMFRGDGKWASSAVSHLQVVKEGATEKDNPLDSQPLGLDDAGEVLAHHTGTIQRSERLLGRPLAARAER